MAGMSRACFRASGEPGAAAGSHKPTSVSLSLPQRAVAAVGLCASPALPKPPTRHSPHTLQHIHAVVMLQQQGTGVRPGLPPADDIGVILRPGGRFAMREERRGAG